MAPTIQATKLSHEDDGLDDAATVCASSGATNALDSAAAQPVRCVCVASPQMGARLGRTLRAARRSHVQIERQVALCGRGPHG
eukprot:6204071-Pleurochrysis_carterae.AAC.3